MEQPALFPTGCGPRAERLGIRLAIHPDDPPLPVFGLPRVVSTLEDLLRLTGAVDLPSNGVTLCTGSLGSSRANDVVKIADRLCAEGKIPFVHGRNVRWEGEEDFCESGHLTASGSLNMAAILAALHRRGFDGVIRADHGRMVWGDAGPPWLRPPTTGRWVYAIWPACGKRSVIPVNPPPVRQKS